MRCEVGGRGEGEGLGTNGRDGCFVGTILKEKCYSINKEADIICLN